MCGIAGIWNLDNKPLQKETLARFTDSIKHRGPDGSGYEIMKEAQLGLGHRRLSILDLSDAARQPMEYLGRYVITYNGEIYNFIELRKELEKAGYTFRSHSDTEIILAAFDKWGTSCFSRFNGMWAMAIWDKKEKQLLLCRDRFGVKPLHYTFIPGKLFAFASETYAFKFLDNYSKKIHPQLTGFAINNVNALEGYGYTIFEGIYQLLPGHFITLRTNDHALHQKRWWNILEQRQTVPSTYEEQVEQFAELFSDACRLRLRSDVTLATALSGGVDSSSVYCMIHHLFANGKGIERSPESWQKAFVAIFPDSPANEEHFAKEVLAYTGGKATFVAQHPDSIADDIISSTLLFDSISPSPLPAISDVYRAMSREGVKVSLDGHGVDEMMYGYTYLVGSAYGNMLAEGNTEYASGLLDTYTDMFPDSGKQEARTRLVNSELKNKKMYSPGTRGVLKRKIKNIRTIFSGDKIPVHQFSNEFLSAETHRRLDNLSDCSYKTGNLAYHEKLLFDDFTYHSLPVNLRDFDRASMQSSLEIRMPFMDWRLVSYVFSLPLSSKLGKGYTKRILRDAMKHRMPEAIRLRKLKIGINAPNDQWFSLYLKKFILDTVSSDRFKQSEIWNGKKVKEFVDEKYRQESWTLVDARRIWSIVNAHLVISAAN